MVMYWYWRDPGDGIIKTIAYCISPTCVLLVCYRNCPKFLARLKVKGMTLVLLNVSEEDSGLHLQGTIIAPDLRQVYTIKISAVLPGQCIAYITDGG